MYVESLKANVRARVRACTHPLTHTNFGTNCHTKVSVLTYKYLVVVCITSWSAPV